MTRPRPPSLHRTTTRHGAVAWYVRIDHGPRIRIRGEYGSKEFMAAYHAAVAGKAPQAEKPLSKGTIAWLIARYRDSGDWLALAQGGRTQREHIFRKLIADVGSEPFEALTKRSIVAAMDRRRETPAAANHLLKSLRGLFRWAVKADLVEADPTLGIAKMRYKVVGFVAWDASEIEAFRAHWPLGTPQRTAFEVVLNTGLRRSDAVRVGRQHVRDGVISIKTEKTGAEVHIPISADLAVALEHAPKGQLAFVVGPAGKPLTKESFGNWFREACNAAGINKSAHGLRKADAVATAEAGATDPEMMARFGWSDHAMASLYTKSASRKRLAIEAGAKRERAKDAPKDGASHSSEKARKINGD